MKHSATLVLCLTVSAPCTAQQICLWVDPQGNKTIASEVVKGASKVYCHQYGPPARPAPAAPAATKRSAAEEAPFPKVDGATQKRRDDERRRILEQELMEERSLLEQARRELAQAERGGGDGRGPEAGKAREALAGHERNVAAIEKEIARLR